jgi:hypothetical protein
MFALAVQPPSQTRPGVALYPPIVARLSSDTSIFEELSQIWAMVSLISPSGEVLYEKLEGKVADSAHPIAESGHGGQQGAMRDRAYFYFPDLVIQTPGRYRVRVTLMRVSYSFDSSPEGEVRYDDYVDTHFIVVEEGVPNLSRPSESRMISDLRTVLTVTDSRERNFLRMLREDGQDVPSTAST